MAGKILNLAEILQDEGLEEEFWLTQLAKLEVVSVDELYRLEGDTVALSKLLEGIRDTSEKKALEKLLKIDEVTAKDQEAEGQEGEEHEKTEQEVMKIEKKNGRDEKEGKQVSHELIETRSDGKDRLDHNCIQECEKVHVASVSSDKFLEKLILDEGLEEDSVAIQESDASLLQKSSGGRALQGVLLTNNLKDLQEERQCLLKVPENISIVTACGLKSDIASFSSKSREESYRAAGDILGHSIAAAAQVPVYENFAIGEGMSESNRNNKESKYSSTIRYCSMHVVSYTFSYSDLKLSDEAKEDLKKITASESNVQGECERFLYTYGSHVNQGPLQFGANFWWICSSHGVDTEEIEMVKELQSEVITTSSGVSSAAVSSEVNIDSIKSNYAGKCSESTLASTQLKLYLNGGPTDASDLSAWKNGLKANNSTWILTDRGSKLVAVWDVIGMNHREELGEVQEVLKKAWKDMTKLESKPEFMSSLEYDPEDVLKEVSKWNGKVLTPHDFENNLVYMLKVKEDALNKVVHPQYWVDRYLLQEVLQKFFFDVINSEVSLPTWDIMQKLVDDSDLKKLSTSNFPDIERISEWLHKKPDQPSSLEVDCEDFESFFNYLKQTIEEVKVAKPVSSIFTSASVATRVSQAIHSLRSNYKGTYDDIFIKILVFLFQSNKPCTSRESALSLEDLKHLLEKFTEEREKYMAVGASALQKQSFLFLLAVSSCKMPQKALFNSHLREIGQMMNDFEPPLETVISDELNSYLCGTLELSQFKQNLYSLLATSHLPNQPQRREGISLLHLLSTVVPERTTPRIEHVIPMIQINPKAHTLFSKLGLTQYYENKLGLQNARCIQSELLEMSLGKSSPTEPKQLPFLALQKLMSFDSHLMKDVCPKGKSGNSTKINPADILLALIICSDHFLRQDLFARLAKCQYAIPFILPDPFTKELLLPLWAMRSITKEWKCVQPVQGEEKVVEHASSIVKYPMPIISFLRLGKGQKRGASKSKILNRVISESEHFFHRDLPGGSFERILGDGLVDISWYFPSGKKADDVFPDAVTFLNLHGDARSHPVQSRFLSEISSMCFILLTEEDLEFNEHTIKTLEDCSLSTGGITLLKGVDKTPEALMSATSIKLEEFNEYETTAVIQEQIREKLFMERQFKRNSLECCAALVGKDILVDEDTETFEKGQKHADELLSLVREGKSIKLSAKEKMLPLQGDALWREWSDLNKEWHRLEGVGKASAYDYAQDIEKKKVAIRSHQHEKYVETLTPVMEKFIRSLLELEHKDARNYFLQYLILNLNSLSGERISELLIEYQTIRGKMFELQHTTGDAESKKKARKENADKLAAYHEILQELESAIVKASFGFHYLLRELGQVYEATCEESSKYGNKLSRLPTIAAELLLEGYPLELMDGDAAHVPVKWVQAVMSEVEKKLDDPRIFVLSVLGIQSTGKSTMLNTVFGLAFKTSAAKCTRGAFMQLLPVDETLKAATGYSYVLVVDTEGLRTQKLDSSKKRKHDNEIATFIIGLANLTFINISGEVVGDLDDILQTTVHAFLRMSEVKEDPSCQFIHQNAGASAKGLIERGIFEKQLDKWTLAAAQEERCADQYEKFSDVIQFDDQEDVYHFPGLWKGDPPMAPVNHGYSQAALRMKFNLLQKLHREAKSTNVSSFKIKINNLWEALLKENFVFSFKNTEEIVAYNLLGTNFNRWERKIQVEVLDWERKAANEINTEKIIDKIPHLVEDKRKEILKLVSRVYELQKEEMHRFFSEHKLKAILIQWKAKFELKLDYVKKNWEAHAKKHCEQLGRMRHALSTFEVKRMKYIAVINGKAQKAIADMKREQDELDEILEKGKLDREQLEKIMKFKYTLFTPEKMSEIGITLSEQQKLTEEDVQHILVSGLLTPEQAKTVLKEGRLNEKELKAEFDKTWIELVGNLPPVYNEEIDVEESVERKLTEFAEKFTVKNSLKDKRLRDWGERFTQGFIVEETHYKILKGSKWFGNNLQANNDPQQDETQGKADKKAKGHEAKRDVAQKTIEAKKKLQKMTADIFEEMREYFKSTKDLKTSFNDGCTLELLHKLEKAIEDKASEYAVLFSFTQDYRIEVYLTVCGYAVTQFEEMEEAFRQQNDPKEYLEKYQREPLFSMFKNQYYRTEAEAALASTFCAALTSHITEQIESSLGTKIVEQMHCLPHLQNKMALKAQILIHLGIEGDFEKYMTYLTDTKQSLKYWIERYTIEYCNEKESSDGTHLQVLAKREISRVIFFLECKVQEVRDEVASKWLSTFYEDMEVRRELGALQLDIDTLLPNMELKLDLQYFKEQMQMELHKLEKKLHSSFGKVMCDREEILKWQVSPYDLLKRIRGCTEQCPFCGEQCDQDEHSDTKLPHSIAQHRPQGFMRYCTPHTKFFILDICPQNVADEHATFKISSSRYSYVRYRDIYPNWQIVPDRAARNSLYWMWFTAKYGNDFARHYGVKDPEVPSRWTDIEWKDVKTHLEELYNLNSID